MGPKPRWWLEEGILKGICVSLDDGEGLRVGFALVEGVVERVLVVVVPPVVVDLHCDVVFEVVWIPQCEENLRDAASWLVDGEFVGVFHDACTPVGGGAEAPMVVSGKDKDLLWCSECHIRRSRLRR